MGILTPEEREAAHARQQARYMREKARKQFDEREHLRAEIPSRKLVQDVINIGDILHAGKEAVVLPSGRVEEMELDRTRINALKSAAEIKFKLLAKTVPDLKQIELRADVTQEVLPGAIEFVVVKGSDRGEDGSNG